MPPAPIGPAISYGPHFVPGFMPILLRFPHPDS
jgi:hypothetical protein